MPRQFAICQELKQQYAGLTLDPTTVRCITTGPGILFWSDEHPGGHSGVYCHPECRRSMAKLCQARAVYWRTGIIPSELEPLWDEARETLPRWPGFERLNLSEAARQDFAQGERDAATYRAFEKAATAGARTNRWESSGGGWRTKIAITVQRPKKPWWRFW